MTSFLFSSLDRVVVSHAICLYQLWKDEWQSNSKSFITYESKTFLLVSNNSKVDNGISMFLDGGQQCRPVRISNLSWVKVILRIQELHVHKQELFF